MTLQDFLLASILLIEIPLFVYFYSKTGAAAIYCAWYAWIIDALAIMSGFAIMALAFVAQHNPELFNFKIPFLLIAACFLLGSWQALIHMVKWRLRRCEII